MMMKKYAVAAAFAGSLLAAPAFAQDATSCDAMLSDFDSHLAANNIQSSDERVTQARSEAEQACLSGDMTAAETSLNDAYADLGIAPRAEQGTLPDTTGSDASGSATGSATDTTGSESDTQSDGSSTVQ